MSNILLINDMPSFGKVALAAMNPILGYQGHRVYSLPTGLVSNTLDYGQFEILETTDYMRKTLAVWKNLGFEFDCICTGFIISNEQSEWIAEVLKNTKALKVVDPIMGDDGHLYNGVVLETVNAMKRLCEEADLVIPNFTEASYLTGLYQNQQMVNEEEIRRMIDVLRQGKAKSVVITSVILNTTDHHCVAGYCEKTKEYFILDYDYIDVRVPGTGDIFSSVLVGCVLNQEPLKTAIKKAMHFVYQIIASHQNIQDTYRGVIVERFLHLLPKDDKNNE